MSDDENIGGIIKDDIASKLLRGIPEVDRDSAITIFREWKPREDVIEYTLYFVVDGIRHRIDFDIDSYDMEILGDDPEGAVSILVRFQLKKYVWLLKNRPDLLEAYK